MRLHTAVLTTAVLVLGSAAGCSDDSSDSGETPDDALVERGQAVYELTQTTGNSFTCETCHALEEPAADGILRPGHPIGDFLRRPDFKNGELDSALAAVNTCLKDWMTADEWTEESEDWLALQAYIRSEDEGDGEADELEFTIVPAPADVAGGDVDAGRSVFNQSCSICHGRDAGGTNKAPGLSGQFLQADYVAERIRLSGGKDSPVYDGLTGGRMPFWSAERLTDEEVIDLVAFVTTNEGSGGGDNGSGGTGGGMGGSPGLPGRDCASTSARIGEVATFTTRFHQVAGTATIVDDCTIEVEDFVYDGQGIVVDFYGALGEDYDAGFPFGLELTRSTPYDGESITIQLPEDKTLDDIDSLSVWCVDVSISFGDGVFVAP